MNLFSIIYFYVFIFLSTIGYGYLFSKIFIKNYLKLNIGYHGLLGLIFLLFVSYSTNLFLPHTEKLNLLIHTIGILSFIIHLVTRFELLKKDLLISFLLLGLGLSGLIIFKTHDDFPYYHLPYALTLVENKFIYGLGILNHGFKSPSSLFYLYSITYLPIIKIYIVHSIPLLILLFSNLILLEKIIGEKYLRKNQHAEYIKLFSIFSFIFINIVFYRLAEHGTDRSGQIIFFLIIILLFEILTKEKAITDEIKLLLILITFSITIKIYFIVNVIFLLLLIFNRHIREQLFRIILKDKITIFLCLLVIFSFHAMFASTACFLYPKEFSCLKNLIFSIKEAEIKALSPWFELWSKAGAAPNFKVQDPEIYVKGINWVPNWIDNYFFTKVSDTLGAIILMSIIIVVSAKRKIKKRLKLKSFFYIYPFIILLFFEWFFGHPTLRYGGFAILALVIFLPISYLLFSKNFIIKTKTCYFLIFLTLIIYNYRNIDRINHEMKMYSKNNLKDPYFYVDDVKFTSKSYPEGITINKTIHGEMCWATPAICGNHEIIKIKKNRGFIILYK